jgi:hypothetical protein
MEVEGIRVWHVDMSVKPNEAVSILGPPQGHGAIGIVEVFFDDGVVQDCHEDVLVKFLNIYKNDTTHNRVNKVSSTDRHG